MIDKTGQLRTNEELDRALSAVKKSFFNPLKVPPELFVELPTIKNALEELLLRRHSANAIGKE